jgi:Sec-independent protein translocase protein TatA
MIYQIVQSRPKKRDWPLFCQGSGMDHFDKGERKLQSLNLCLVLMTLLVIFGATPKLVAAQQDSSAAPGREQSAQNPQATAQADKAEKKEAAQDASRENELGLQTIKNIVRDQR